MQLVAGHKAEPPKARELSGFAQLRSCLVELLDRAEEFERLREAVGVVNPRPPGWWNNLLQFGKTLLARSLSWYTRPLRELNEAATRSLAEALSAMAILETRVTEAENRGAQLAQALDDRIELLRLERRSANDLEGRAALPTALAVPGNQRTIYVIGLFGSGRQYVCELIRQNVGERARYFRDRIRLHPGPTAMIYSGHATLRHVARGQNLPEVTHRVLGAVKAGFADLIFVYRHPLDSLLTNWIWWRTHIRDNSCISGITELYGSAGNLCAHLEQNFSEFEAFARGDADFFAGAPAGPRFLSFDEFVEETELYVRAGPSLSLRFEDFAVDPLREFSKIIELMSVDLDLRAVSVLPPKSKPYGYLTVKDQVPRFNKFIASLSAETKRRMLKIGYSC